MERGYTTAQGLFGQETVSRHKSRLMFLVSQVATSLNPIKAFQQGMSGAPKQREYHIVGARCSNCGFLEFFGEEG
jgi:hypothetical protein